MKKAPRRHQARRHAKRIALRGWAVDYLRRLEAARAQVDRGALAASLIRTYEVFGAEVLARSYL